MKPGYAGKDLMRKRAEESMKDMLRESRGPAKMSKSEVLNEKPRLYKKGGHVKAKKCADGGMLGNIPPNRFTASQRSPGIGGMKAGGRVTEGGNPTWPLSGEHGHSEGHMKRGGKIKKMAKGGGNTYYEMAGERGCSEGHMKRGGKAKKCNLGGDIGGQMRSLPTATGMKKGGKTHKKAMGGSMTPGMPMRSMGPMKRGGKIVESKSHERREMSELKKIEKMLGKHARHEEHESKGMAMGGVGKFRHHEATRSGKPLKAKRVSAR